VYVSEKSIYNAGLQASCKSDPNPSLAGQSVQNHVLKVPSSGSIAFIVLKSDVRLLEIRGQTKGHAGFRVKLVSSETSGAIHSLQ